MKGSLAMSALLFVLICGVFAQSGNPVTWEMAVVQEIGSDGQTFPPQRINLKSGDRYFIYLKSDSPGYCYVIQQDPNGASSLIFSSPFTVGRPRRIMVDEEDFITFTVPSGSGIISYDIVVSSTPRPNLEQYWNPGRSLTRAQQTAIEDEVIAIRNSISTFAETPAKPVDMGGNVRGRGEPLKSYQYEGQAVYVKTVTIRY